MAWKTALGYEKLALLSMLYGGASEVFLQEAAVGLIINTKCWLDRDDFREFIEVFGDSPAYAGIHWKAAVAALDDGRLVAEQEEASILRLASSIGADYPVCIGDLAETLSLENVKLLAEAIMHADGFRSAKAQPIPPSGSGNEV